MTLNCIAIDDEPLALSLITTFIKQTPFLNLLGSYSNALDAIQCLQDDTIHLVFLDIHMPELNGMEFSKMMLKTGTPPSYRIVFTTAYNQFAIESYHVDALYYLLKPFSYQEFLQAATKALTFFEGKNNAIVPNKDRFIFVKSDYKLVKIDFDDIRYIESLKDYVRIHLVSDGKPVLSLMTLKAIEEKLPTSEFLRIHRSFIVSVNKIDAIGKSAVHIGKEIIAVGEQYRDNFNLLLSRWT